MTPCWPFRAALTLLFALTGTAFLVAEAPVVAPPSSEDVWLSAALDPVGEVLPPVVLALPAAEHRRIDQAMTYYLGPGRAWVEKALERVKPYRDFIRRRLEEEGMPAEIYWLAAVESGFNAGATSRVGAAGMWQFMKNSVVGYGMSINTYVDERRDWWKSTDGALKKLKDNYRRLGDWYLAMAAYNAGLGRIESIVKKAKGEKDYWKLLDRGLLPKETAGYVPQVLALARLSSRWVETGFTVDWEPSPTWDRVRIDRMVDLRLLAQAAGVSAEELRAANKELVYHLTPVLPGGYNLKVKTEWVEPLKSALDDPELKLIQYYLYKVQQGDTLSEIAQWYGVSVAMIERDNPGLKPSLLKIGQNLIIAALKDIGPYRGSRG